MEFLRAVTRCRPQEKNLRNEGMTLILEKVMKYGQKRIDHVRKIIISPQNTPL